MVNTAIQEDHLTMAEENQILRDIVVELRAGYRYTTQELDRLRNQHERHLEVVQTLIKTQEGLEQRVQNLIAKNKDQDSRFDHTMDRWLAIASRVIVIATSILLTVRYGIPV